MSAHRCTQHWHHIAGQACHWVTRVLKHGMAWHGMAWDGMAWHDSDSNANKCETAQLTFMASTKRGTALEAESAVPYPSWPWSLDPQLKMAPASVRTAVCLLAAATATTRCFKLVTL